jgi:hypothetical protein
MAVQMVKFLCGDGTVDLRIPESVRFLEMQPAQPLSDPDGALKADFSVFPRGRLKKPQTSQ